MVLQAVSMKLTVDQSFMNILLAVQETECKQKICSKHVLFKIMHLHPTWNVSLIACCLKELNIWQIPYLARDLGDMDWTIILRLKSLTLNSYLDPKVGRVVTKLKELVVQPFCHIFMSPSSLLLCLFVIWCIYGNKICLN